MMYFNSTAGGSVTIPGEGSFPNTCCDDARPIVATPGDGCSFVEWTCVDYFAGTCTGYISDPFSPSTTIDLRCLQGPSITAHFGCPGWPIDADVFFEESSYNWALDGDGCDNFHTRINISAPVNFFYGGQFRLGWNASLFRLMDTWTQDWGWGRIYNGSQWMVSLNPTCNLTGAIGCPYARPSIGDGNQGCADFVVDFSNLVDPQGNGVNISAPPSGPAEGSLIYIRWRTAGPGCYGNSVNSGTTDIVFLPTLKLTGYKDGAFDYWGVTWHNTSVQVGP